MGCERKMLPIATSNVFAADTILHALQTEAIEVRERERQKKRNSEKATFYHLIFNIHKINFQHASFSTTISFFPPSFFAI